MPPSSVDVAGLRGALTGMIGTPARIDALASGTTGRSYLVETGSGRFVAKLFRTESDALLGPSEQFDLMRTLAEARVSPRPVGFDSDAGLLVTEFLEGAIPLTPETAGRPENIEKIVRCLRALHETTAEIPRLAPAVHASGYLRRAGGPAALSAADRARYAELSDLASMLDGAALVVCHNDLLAENLLVNGGIRLIDFDYAAMAPPVVDLASLVVMNGLPDREARVLFDAYFGERAPFAPAEFARVQRLVRLIAHFWALASGDAGAAIVAQYRIQDD